MRAVLSLTRLNPCAYHCPQYTAKFTDVSLIAKERIKGCNATKPIGALSALPQQVAFASSQLNSGDTPGQCLYLGAALLVQ